MTRLFERFRLLQRGESGVRVVGRAFDAEHAVHQCEAADDHIRRRCFFQRLYPGRRAILLRRLRCRAPGSRCEIKGGGAGLQIDGQARVEIRCLRLKPVGNALTFQHGRAGSDHGEQRRCSDKSDAGSFEGPHFTALVCRLQKHRSMREPFDFGRCADALRREAPAACVAERFFDNLARGDGDADIQEAGFRLDADNRRVIAEIFSVVGREALKPPPDLIAQVTPRFGGERLDPVQSQFGRQQQIHRRVPPVPSRDPLSHRFNQVLEIRRAMHGFAPVLPAAEGALDQ